MRQCCIDDIDELHNEFFIIDDEREEEIVKFAAIAEKTVKFAVAAQIHEFCESHDVHKNFTA